MASTRLSEADKQAAIDRYRQPGETTATVASEFGVSVSTVSRLLKSELTGAEYDQLMRTKRQAAKDAADPIEADPIDTDPIEVKPDSLGEDGNDQDSIELQPDGLLAAVETAPSSLKPVLKVDRLKSEVMAPTPIPEAYIDPVAQAAADSAAAASDRRSRRRSSAASRSSQLELLPQSNPQVAPGAVPEAKPLAAKIEPKIEAKIEPQIIVRNEVRSESRSESGFDMRVESPLVPEVSLEPEARVELRVELRRDVAPPIKTVRAPIKTRSRTPEVIDEAPAALAGAGDYNLDDEFEDEEDFDDFEDGEDEAPLMPRTGDEQVQVLPLSEANLPRMFYIVIDRMAELVTCPLQEFRDLGELPPEEEAQETLPVFDNHRIAQRFSRRNPKKNQRVIKLPDGRVLAKTSHWLQAKGIQRLLLDGQVYALDR